MPTTPTAPAPPTPANAWSIAGQIVATGTQQGIAGATLTPGWPLAAVQADANGNYELKDSSRPPSTPFPISASSPGFVTHDLWIAWQRGPRTNVTLDMIRNAGRFSMDFYQQFVRDMYDKSEGAPWPLLRWNTAPSFYVRTVDQNGRAIEQKVLAITLEAIRRAVPAFTAGHYSAAAIETGTEERPGRPDWINVQFMRDRKEKSICGRAGVGRNPGTITLWEDVCDCGSNKVPGSVTMHEVGHAMGFFHVSDSHSLMYPYDDGECRSGSLSAAESFHAAIAYSRPPLNTDPDRDPAPFGGLTSFTLGPIVDR
jgi:Matrixin